jgi:hypothetical protein
LLIVTQTLPVLEDRTMSFTALLKRLLSGSRTPNSARPLGLEKKPVQRSFVPCLDVLEDRTLLSAVSFGLPLIYPAGIGITGNAVAVGDFNGDGKLDLALTDAENNSVSVLLGNGDGTFRIASTFSPGPFPYSSSVAVGDFNGDGKLDLVVAGGSGVSVLLGKGDGTFQNPDTYSVSAQSVAVGDLDGRHYANDQPILDLVVVGGSTVSVLTGKGDGTFQSAGNFATGGTNALSVAIGDLNGDGKPDLAVANRSGNVSVLVGNGDGTFQPAQVFAAGSLAFSVAVADLNGDGKPDLAVASLFSGVSVLLGNGDGTFGAPITYDAGSESFSAAVGDFNGDGKPDLVTVASLETDVLPGNGDGTFGVAQFVGPNGIFGDSVAVGDFNGDGKPDIARSGYVALNQFATTTALSGPTSSTYGQPVTYTATVTSAGPVHAGTVTFFDTGTPISPALPLDLNGQATFTFTTQSTGSHIITASYSGARGGAGFTGFGASGVSIGLTVNPAPLSASAINVGATAGAPFSGAVATFTNADPFGSAASYTALIDWGDGTTTLGSITGSGTLTVSGGHTYADPGSYALSVQISHNLGNTTTATVFPTATVTSLGQTVQHGLTGDIGFWNNKSGQALINAFNGGPDATALSSWLATAFPNLYGANAGSNNLSGFSNAQVAAFYQSQLSLRFLFGSNLEAEVLATALNVYASTLSLGGNLGQTYGFSVTATGLGADSFNVGADGAAFGVANNSTRNVYELLEAVNQQAVVGAPLYNGDTTLRKEANDLFDALNQAGAI